MDNFAFNKALNHFNINEDEFMEICNKYDYNQITIEQHYAKEKIMPEIEKWLSKDKDNSITMVLKNTMEDCYNRPYDEIIVSLYEEIVFRLNSYFVEYSSDYVCVEEHQINFENIAKLIFEDASGSEVKQLIY